MPYTLRTSIKPLLINNIGLAKRQKERPDPIGLYENSALNLE